MATNLAQGEGRSSDEPESSKDPSSPLLDDHDGEWRTLPISFLHLPGSPVAPA